MGDTSYYAARSRPPSARAISDAGLHQEILRVFEANYGRGLASRS
jgi:hypothetical protein